MLTLQPILGAIAVAPNIVLHGERNSTRWIIDIEQAPGLRVTDEPGSESVSFQLMLNRAPVRSGIFSFAFGQLTPSAWDARPVLLFSEADNLYTVQAVSGVSRFRLSIDILHSMHR
jgi:hypothetical protein